MQGDDQWFIVRVYQAMVNVREKTNNSHQQGSLNIAKTKSTNLTNETNQTNQTNQTNATNSTAYLQIINRIIVLGWRAFLFRGLSCFRRKLNAAQAADIVVEFYPGPALEIFLELLGALRAFLGLQTVHFIFKLFNALFCLLSAEGQLFSAPHFLREGKRRNLFVQLTPAARAGGLPAYVCGAGKKTENGMARFAIVFIDRHETVLS